jgi:MFS family permease
MAPQENYIIQRVPIAKWLSGNIILWGVTLALQAAMKNFEGLIALRAFLGVFEAVSQPAFTLLSSIWYTREEQGGAVTFWYVHANLWRTTSFVMSGIADFYLQVHDEWFESNPRWPAGILLFVHP